MRFELAIVDFTKNSKSGQKAPWCLRVNNTFIPLTKLKVRQEHPRSFGVSYENGTLTVSLSNIKYTGIDDKPLFFKLIDMPWKTTHVKFEYLTKDENFRPDPVDIKRNLSKVTEEEYWKFRKEEVKKWNIPLNITFSRLIGPDEEPLKQEGIATCHVRKYTRAPRLFKQLGIKLLNKETLYLEIEFDKGMGADAGSWKGGTVGFGRQMYKTETVPQAFSRIVRDFNFGENCYISVGEAKVIG